MKLLFLHFLYGIILAQIGIYIGRIIERKKVIRNQFDIWIRSFRCMICKKMRDQDKIGVITHDISGARGFDRSGICKINVKYCKDDLHCYEIAHVLDKWQDWPRKKPV